MDPVKPAGNCPVDLSLGPLPEAAHSLRVGDAEYKDAWTAAQMHEERERCYALGVAAERERIRALVQAVRDANRDAAEDGETFRLLKPGQERAWMALLAGLDGPNVANNRQTAAGEAGEGMSG